MLEDPSIFSGSPEVSKGEEDLVATDKQEIGCGKGRRNPQE